MQVTDGGYAAGAVLASAVASQASRPLLLIFNEIGLVMAIMGALGGATFVLALRVPWRQAAQPVLLGAMLGFGLSAIAVSLLKAQFGVEVAAQRGGVEVMASAVYLIGLSQERVIAWARGKGSKDERDKPDAT